MAEYRAKCKVGGYTGDWQPTEERAVEDAISHMQSSKHPTEIEKRVSRPETEESDDNVDGPDAT